MTGRGVEQAIQAALDVIQVESRINVVLKSSDGQEAAEDVERNWHKRVLAIKYLQLKEELEAGQPSKGGVEALRKLLQRRGLGEALAGDAEKAGEKLRKMWSLQKLVKRRRHGEQLLLFYNGVEVEAQPQGDFPPNMMLFHFSHEELLCFPAKAAKVLTAENQGLTAENQRLKMRLQRSQQQQYFLVSALVMTGAVAVFMYLKSVAEFPA